MPTKISIHLNLKMCNIIYQLVAPRYMDMVTWYVYIVYVRIRFYETLLHVAWFYMVNEFVFAEK